MKVVEALRVWAVIVMVLAVGGRWVAGKCVGVTDGPGGSLASPGNAILTALLPLHQGTDCSQLSLTEVQVGEAIQLAATKFNEQGLIPGVTLGVRLVDTCGVPSFDAKMAAAAWVEDSMKCPQPDLTLGILGASNVAAGEAAANVMHPLGVPVVPYGPRPAPAPLVLDLLNPAPYSSAQAVVQVLIGAGINSVSLVHTDDTEGEVLAQHFTEAADYYYVCVDVDVAGSDGSVAFGDVLAGPGTVVVLGSRQKVQVMAQALGKHGGPAELLVLMDVGPVPQVELALVTVPTIVLQRIAPVLPEFLPYLNRDLEADDDARQQYLDTVAACDSCSTEFFGYDPAVPAAVASVLSYGAALIEAHTTSCGGVNGLCPELKKLAVATWEELLKSAELDTSIFPELTESALHPGNDDAPRYTVFFMDAGNTTHVGVADASSSVLGELIVPDLRCGRQCPCKEIVTHEPLPDAANITRHSKGVNVFGGSDWWSWKMPVLGIQNPTKAETAMYITVASLIIIVIILSGMVCTYSVIKPPPRR